MFFPFPLYLGHVVIISKSVSPYFIWWLLFFNILLVGTAIVCIYKLLRQQSIQIPGLIFGVILLINFVIEVYFGSIFDLLG
jgi:hypothetical protein